MDKRTLELLALAEKLRQYSDEDFQIIRTEPLADMLDSADTLPDEEVSNVIHLPDKAHL